MKSEFKAASQAAPGGDTTASTLSSCLGLAGVYRGLGYRAAGPEYASPTKLLDGHGSMKRGARWSPPGIAAAYASLDLEATLSEVLAHCRYYNYPVEEAFPLAIVAFRIDMHRVLDLANPAVLAVLGNSWDLITGEDWRAVQRSGGEPFSQKIGRQAFEGRLEGLIVPSAVHPDRRNLVLFPENFDPKSHWEIINKEKLRGLP